MISYSVQNIKLVLLPFFNVGFIWFSISYQFGLISTNSFYFILFSCRVAGLIRGVSFVPVQSKSFYKQSVNKWSVYKLKCWIFNEIMLTNFYRFNETSIHSLLNINKTLKQIIFYFRFLWTTYFCKLKYKGFYKTWDFIDN